MYIKSLISPYDNTTGEYNAIIDNLWTRVSTFVNCIQPSKIHTIKTVFDIGSLNGLESLILSKMLPNAIIHSFEPNCLSPDFVHPSSISTQQWPVLVGAAYLELCQSINWDF